MRIAIASGKGGTGKTTIATNLSLLSGDSLLVDCDVEEPNCHLFLEAGMETDKVLGIPKPVIDPEDCTRCGECSGFCRYNALFTGKEGVLFFENLCHGCGGCRLVCPVGAISEEEMRIGEIRSGSGNGYRLLDGVLDISIPSGVPIIRELKGMMGKDYIAFIDCPPGTSCSAVESIRDSDVCILVTEPTPFGLHDLKAAVEVVRSLEVPFGVVINREGIGNDEVMRWLEAESIPLLGTIPNDMGIARVYSRGKIVVRELPEYRHLFERILERVSRLVAT
ncbi:MAG: 4Fe-4S binding protein [Thermoplasmatota archaeon]